MCARLSACTSLQTAQPIVIARAAHMGAKVAGTWQKAVPAVLQNKQNLPQLQNEHFSFESTQGAPERQQQHQHFLGWYCPACYVIRSASNEAQSWLS